MTTKLNSFHFWDERCLAIKDGYGCTRFINHDGDHQTFRDEYQRYVTWPQDDDEYNKVKEM